jgi:hypothetical protein
LKFGMGDVDFEIIISEENSAKKLVLLTNSVESS